MGETIKIMQRQGTQERKFQAERGQMPPEASRPGLHFIIWPGRGHSREQTLPNGRSMKQNNLCSKLEKISVIHGTVNRGQKTGEFPSC